MNRVDESDWVHWEPLSDTDRDDDPDEAKEEETKTPLWEWVFKHRGEPNFDRDLLTQIFNVEETELASFIQLLQTCTRAIALKDANLQKRGVTEATITDKVTQELKGYQLLPGNQESDQKKQDIAQTCQQLADKLNLNGNKQDKYTLIRELMVAFKNTNLSIPVKKDLVFDLAQFVIQDRLVEYADFLQMMYWLTHESEAFMDFVYSTQKSVVSPSSFTKVWWKTRSKR